MKFCERIRITFKAMKNVWNTTKSIKLQVGDTLNIHLKYNIKNKW